MSASSADGWLEALAKTVRTDGKVEIRVEAARLLGVAAEKRESIDVEAGCLAPARVQVLQMHDLGATLVNYAELTFMGFLGLHFYVLCALCVCTHVQPRC